MSASHPLDVAPAHTLRRIVAVIDVDPYQEAADDKQTAVLRQGINPRDEEFSRTSHTHVARFPETGLNERHELWMRLEALLGNDRVEYLSA